MMKLQKESKTDELLEIRKFLDPLNRLISCEACNLASRCCDAGYVYLLPVEVERYIELSIPLVKLHGVYFLKKMNGPCAFFSKEKKTCEIYEERPLVCRLFPVDLSYENGQLVWSYFSDCPYLHQNYAIHRLHNTLYKIVTFLERYFHRDLFSQFLKTNLVYPRLEPDFINSHQYRAIRPFQRTVFPLK